MKPETSGNRTRPRKSHWPIPRRRPMAFYIDRARQTQGFPGLSSQDNATSAYVADIDALAEMLVETIRPEQLAN